MPPPDHTDPPARARPRTMGSWVTPGRFILVFVIFLCAAYPDVIFGRNTFFFRDFGYFAYPLAHYHHEAFWRGEIPLWNPLSNCGLPFLAQWNTLVLYPGSLIYLLLPVVWSAGMFCLLHLLLAGVGMYRLAHRWTSNEWAAAVAGIAFGFNGLLLNSLMWPNNIAAFGLMPWVVLTVERAWREGGRRVVIAALVGAAQMLAGAPEVIFFTWCITGLFLLQQAALERSDRLRFAGRFAAVIALIAAVAAAQLLPFLDLLRHSHRDVNFANSGWAMPETGWANLIVPAFRTYLNRQDVIFQYGQYWTSSYYLGIGILALVVFTIWRVRERRVYLLAAIWLASLVLALGDAGYFYAGIRNLFPQIGFMRYPIKFVIATTFCAPLLAAYGVVWLHQAAPEQRAAAQRTLGMIWGALLAAAAVIVWFSFRFPLDEEDWRSTATNAIQRAVFLSTILAVLLVRFRVQRTTSQRMAELALLAVLVFDIFTHTPRQNPTLNRFALEPGLVKLDPQPRHGHSRAMLTPEADHKLRFTFTSKPFNDYICSRLGLFSNCNLLEGIPKVNGFYSLYLKEVEDIRKWIYESTNAPMPSLYDFLGVSQITAPGKYFEWQARTNFGPFVSLGQKPVFTDDPHALGGLLDPRFDGRTMVFIPHEAKDQLLSTNAATGRIEKLETAAHRIAFQTEADGPTVAVISQAFYHRWHAWVDEQPAPLLRANYGFQAIPVPAGRHTVRVEYRDPAFRAGAIISLVTLIALGACFFRWRKRSPSEISGPADPLT